MSGCEKAVTALHAGATRMGLCVNLLRRELTLELSASHNELAPHEGGPHLTVPLHHQH